MPHRGLERRKTDRSEFVVKVEYCTVDDLFSEFTRNINEGGIFIETHSPAELGTSIDLQFQLPEEDQPVSTTGLVVHVSDGSGAEPSGMGIEFDDLDPDTRSRVDSLVRRLRAAAPR